MNDAGSESLSESEISALRDFDALAGNAGISEYYINIETLEVLRCTSALKKIGQVPLVNLIESTYSETFGNNNAHTQMQRDEMIYALSEAEYEKRFSGLYAELDSCRNAIFEYLEDPT